jgi:antitoxin component of RelBE/YafQ-DinJ toxin-antitoxin module
MSEDSSYRVRVDQELKDAFLKVANACDRTGAQLVRDFMRRYARENRDALQRGPLEEISDQEGEDIV